MKIRKFQVVGRFNMYNQGNINILVTQPTEDTIRIYTFDAGNSPDNNETFCREVQAYVENAKTSREVEELLGHGEIASNIMGHSKEDFFYYTGSRQHVKCTLLSSLVDNRY